MEPSRAALLLDSLARQAVEEDSGHGIRAISRRPRAGRRPRDGWFERRGWGDFRLPRIDDLRYSNWFRLWPALLVSVILFVVGGLIFVPGLRRVDPLEDRMPRVGSDEVAAVDAILAGSETTAKGQTPEGAPARRPQSEEASGAGNKATGSGASDVPGDSKNTGPERFTVHVAGAVASPGVVELAGRSRVVDAIAAAGGLLAESDPDRLNLAAPLSDAMKIYVPAKGEAVPADVSSGIAATAGGTVPSPSTGSTGGTATGIPGTGLVNINTADAGALDGLPGVGPSTAAAIIAKRTADGPFTSVEGLLDVRGIGEAKLDAMRDMVTTG